MTPMASSSRSAFRLFSSSAVRAELPGASRSSGGFRGQVGQFMERMIQKEEAAAASTAMRAWANGGDDTVAEIPGRRRVDQHQFIRPAELSREHMYAPDPPRARAPLLGPRAREARKIDPFHIAHSSPLDQTFNPLMGAAFINQVGRIRSRAETGLTWKSQRAAGKLVRRQRAMGIISQWSGRPAQGGYGWDSLQSGWN